MFVELIVGKIKIQFPYRLALPLRRPPKGGPKRGLTVWNHSRANIKVTFNHGDDDASDERGLRCAQQFVWPSSHIGGIPTEGKPKL